VSAGTFAPDLVRPVIGYRQWRLRSGALHSMWTDDRWDGGELAARCRAELFDATPGPESAPDPMCTCGVHAWHRQVPLGASVGRELVAGAVAPWGPVEVHAAACAASARGSSRWPYLSRAETSAWSWRLPPASSASSSSRIVTSPLRRWLTGRLSRRRCCRRQPVQLLDVVGYALTPAT
jgi:hypothetical protein